MSTVIVVAVLLLIFMSNQFAETLGEAADNLVPREAVFELLGLQFLKTLTVIAPVGVLLGVLLALARLNRDSEMSALAACGIGPGSLLRPVGLLGLIAAAGVGWLAIVKAPEASRIIQDIHDDARENSEFGTLMPGGFMSIDSGSAVLHAVDVDGNQLGSVFFEREIDNRLQVVIADRGELVGDAASGEYNLRLSNGSTYQGSPGDRRFEVARFEEQGIPIKREPPVPEDKIESHPTSQLLTASDPASQAELAWRIASPLSILVLAILAVPLGRSSPREGKYARVGLGLLIYIVYANSLSISQLWIGQAIVPAWAGTWVAHGALALLAVAMLSRQSGAGRSAPTLRVRHEPTA